MIGILGGTFDPVHNGHIRLAIEFYERLGLTELRLIPLRIPPHREPPLAGPEHRLKMLQLAVENISGLVVDDCEIRKDTTSYTIETVRLIKNRIGDLPACLLMGFDAFSSIHTWHRWEELLEFVHIAIADRPGNNDKVYTRELVELIKSHLTGNVADLRDSQSGKIYRLTMPMLDISATQIREIVSNNQCARGLLPGEVLEFINTNNLYNTKT